jgi:AcrR family transcriptional regulator
MREWVPVPGSSRGDLVRVALREFAARGYEAVNVGELARAAGVTTGSLYHHFGSKAGLYGLVREDVERRVLDRMEGAAQARAGDGSKVALGAALVVGFDWAAQQGMALLLAEPYVGRQTDPIADFLARTAGHGQVGTALAAILAAAWRAALQSTTDGVSITAARQALAAIRLADD